MPDDLTRQLLNDAMRLPQEQRAALAAAFIESLDHGVDEDVKAAWSVEITRRRREVESAHQPISFVNRAPSSALPGSGC
jgi:hypothetical protein